MSHGVMVTQLVLVQSFKVRILVGQRKKPLNRKIGRLFSFTPSPAINSAPQNYFSP